MTFLPDFSDVTELAGDSASREQVQRAYQRYYWAGRYMKGADVLEVACGAGQGVGYLASLAKSLHAGDISEQVLKAARDHYGARMGFRGFNAEKLPYPDSSFDVVLMFEAIYYLRDPDRFIQEARRVLRPGGYLLLVTANKDLFDFTPSPHSVSYYGVRELAAMLGNAGFAVAFFGDSPLASASRWQRLLRPVKRLATALGVMPKSKRMKALLKRVVFGTAQPLPAEIAAGVEVGPAPVPIPAGYPDTLHKVIFCEARRGD
jgi:ubiquinone/menaquinone biosynthesis C-methylase UbiE